MGQSTPTQIYKHQNQNLISYAIIFLLITILAIATYAVFFQAKTVVPDNQQNTVSKHEAEKKPTNQNEIEQSIREPVEQQAEKPIVQSTGSLTAEDISEISDKYLSIATDDNPEYEEGIDFTIIDGTEVDNVLSKYLSADEPRRISYNRQVGEFAGLGRKTALVLEPIEIYSSSHTQISLMFHDGDVWQYYSAITPEN